MLLQWGNWTREELVPGSDGTTIADNCFRYNNFGHIAWSCSQEEGTDQGKRGVFMLQHGISLV